VSLVTAQMRLNSIFDRFYNEPELEKVSKELNIERKTKIKCKKLIDPGTPTFRNKNPSGDSTTALKPLKPILRASSQLSSSLLMKGK